MAFGAFNESGADVIAWSTVDSPSQLLLSNAGHARALVSTLVSTLGRGSCVRIPWAPLLTLEGPAILTHDPRHVSNCRYDASSDFIASQSFTDAQGRRVLFGWVGGPHSPQFNGAQSIPRVIQADDMGPLRFLPLPELTTLHRNLRVFNTSIAAVSTAQSSSNTRTGATAKPQERSAYVLVRNTSNSFHLNVTFDVSAIKIAAHPRTPTNASLSIAFFVDAAGAVGTSGTRITLLPPWSVLGQEVLQHTSTQGPILRKDAAAAGSATKCGAACVADSRCGAWTFRTPAANTTARPTPLQQASETTRQVSCLLRARGARAFANHGSGCDALGISSKQDGCTSGIVGWQIRAGAAQPLPVLMPLTGPSTIKVELFVDQQIAEVFLHDGRGHGSMVSSSLFKRGHC